MFGRRFALFPDARCCDVQMPANPGSRTMIIIAIAFIGSTIGLLTATAWEIVQRLFGRAAP